MLYMLKQLEYSVDMISMTKSKKITIEDVSKLLRDALAEPRGQYRTHYRNRLVEQVDAIASKLAANGMDLELVAPYPRSNIGRNAYLAAVDLYQFARRFFASVKCSRSMRDPDIVAPKPNRDEILDKLADEATARYFDGYVIKLSVKIGKPIASAKLVGSLWTDSTLNVICEDGENQVWHTQCIFNTSCLGRIFNQWPTRRKA